MSETSFNFGANRTVAGREMDVDDFLGHRSRDRSSNVLLRSSEWKKEGKIDLWLHTGTKIASVWRHSFWRVVEREDKETKRKEKVVVFSPWNCHEDEQTLKRQYKRRTDGTRVVPPERCPFDKLAEEVRGMVKRGELRWTDPVLKFEGDDKSQSVLVRAGDFWNAFGSKDLDQDEIGQLRRAGVDRRNAWKTALLAKCSYLFVAVDDTDLAAGARILIEGEALGRAMQKAISEKMEEAFELHKDKLLGNPFKNPYLFRWTYDDAKDFADKYGAKAFMKKPSDEVLAIIRDAEPPDTSDELAFGDVDELRALLETHAVVKLPLDACFPPRDPVGTQEKPKDSPPSLDGPERFDCDHCGAKEAMTIDDLACPKCNATYGQIQDGEGVATVLFTRPCTACKAQIALPGTGAPGAFGEHVKCGQCGAEHFEEHGEPRIEGGALPVEWMYVEVKPEIPKEEPKPAARRARR